MCHLEKTHAIFMRPLKTLIISITMTIMSCSDEDQHIAFKDPGTILGADLSLCACCGGWFIEINNEKYRFEQLPEDSNIDLNAETYPIQVNLDWATDPNACLPDEILIGRIEKVPLAN